MWKGPIGEKWQKHGSKGKIEEGGGVWIFGTSPFLNDPQQCFVLAVHSFPLGRSQLLNDSSGGSPLFRGYSSSGISFKGLQHKSIGDSQALRAGFLSGLGISYRLPDRPVREGKHRRDTGLDGNTLMCVDSALQNTQFAFKDTKQPRALRETGFFILQNTVTVLPTR